MLQMRCLVALRPKGKGSWKSEASVQVFLLFAVFSGFRATDFGAHQNRMRDA